jgi:hypothetical protein
MVSLVRVIPDLLSKEVLLLLSMLAVVPLMMRGVVAAVLVVATLRWTGYTANLAVFLSCGHPVLVLALSLCMRYLSPGQ